jgi:dihydroneopterin aldolase
MSDTIFIHEARFPCHIGVTPEERAGVQDVLVDIDLGVELATAGTGDSIKQTIDYAEAWETIRACVSNDEFHLVEALATRVANVMLARYAVVEWVTVRVSKPAALASRGVGSVGVQLTVRRDGAGG